MFVIVVGGGRIGFYLTKELLAEGHEIVLMEKDPGVAERIRDELGAVVVNRDGCEGTHLAEAGANRAAIVAAVTGDDADNQQVGEHLTDQAHTNNSVVANRAGTAESVTRTVVVPARSSAVYRPVVAPIEPGPDTTE